MPLATVYTNVSTDTKSFCKNMSKIVSKVVGLEEKFVYVHLFSGQSIVKGGTDEPTAYVYLNYAKGFGTIEQKRETAKEVMDFVKKHLKIPPGRTFLIFQKPPAEDVALEDGILSDLGLI